MTKPARAIEETPANRPHVLACNAPSTGSIASLSTSQNRNSRIPVAVAVKNAFTLGDSPCIRPIGSPMKIVSPAIAPSSKVWAVDIVVRFTLQKLQTAPASHASDLEKAASTVAYRMAQGHSADEYLETIYFLAFPIGEYRPQSTGSATLASRVAEMLGVSRASAGEMLKRLEGEGLIERGEQKEAILTETGRARAEKVVRKHRIIERLLTDFMGYTAAEAHVHADELGDTFSDEMVERIEVKLGNPERCPHGWPVDPDFEQAENQELSPLADLDPPAEATIVRLAEHDGELLHWFYDEGFVPGTKLELHAAQPAAGQFTVKVDGTEKAIGEKAAAGLFVRPAG